MHRISILATLMLLCLTSWAAPVSTKTANTVATHYLQQLGLMKPGDALSLYDTYQYVNDMGQSINCFYVFNLNTEGFVIVGADDRCTPIIGRSMNGAFNRSKLPENMKLWMQDCVNEIGHGINANAPENNENLKLWGALYSDKATPSESAKSENFLLTSTWEQGSGYNRYCPVWNGHHVVVGCVATAMAQIIRYHGYPTRGFGHKSYRHTAYGIQSVDFDTTDFDYSLMPDEVSYYSSDAERDMVSKLCYYCGVVVNMEYEHEGHTSGSGAHTHNVVEGIMHFGYTDCEHYVRTNISDDTRWKNMIRNEIDNLRPIEYSGFSNDGGHAFVLDGYNSRNEYHFNWGWGGYCDGFYTLTTMQGFVNTHEMVINIKPSGWDGHLSIFHASPNGNGGGTSWEDANSNIASAIKLNNIIHRDIWLKEGIYYGDTNSEYAFNMSTAANIVGGFAGTETATNQRDTKLHQTIFDGRNRHGVLTITARESSSNEPKISDIILQNGYSENGACVYINSDITANQLDIRNCRSDSGSVLNFRSGFIRRSKIYGNNAPTICLFSEGKMRQCLICNNDGDAVKVNGYGRIVNSDIVSNAGTGVDLSYSRSSMVNCIVWNNDTNLRINTELGDTNLRYCAIGCDTAFSDSTMTRLDSENDSPYGPKFLNPNTTKGVDGLTDDADWHLGRGSVCIDAGEKLTECILDGDLDRAIRCRNGIMDLGCYESNYPVGIAEVATAKLAVYPNPAADVLTVLGCGNAQVDLYDIAGRRIYSHQSQDDTLTLDLSHYVQGIYFVKVGANTAKVVKK